MDIYAPLSNLKKPLKKLAYLCILLQNFQIFKRPFVFTGKINELNSIVKK
jgi:hypothetical protein